MNTNTLNLQSHGPRKQLLIKRLLKTIEQYERVLSKPVKMQILSAKYSKMLMNEGGFPETIDELEASGLISIELLATGARLVRLGNRQAVDIDPELLEKTKLYF